MATYLHFAPAVALAVALGPRVVGWRLMFVGAACAVMPDADFVSVWLGLDSYAGPYGHRGFTHSLGFALLVGLLGAGLTWRTPQPGWRRGITVGYLALCTASHPLLDGLLNVGICNAWSWPLDGARLCLPWRPVPAAGVGLFGAARLWLELQWIGLPLLLMANAGWGLRMGWEQWRRRGRVATTPNPTAWVATRPDSPRTQRRLRMAAMHQLALSLQAGRMRRPAGA